MRRTGFFCFEFSGKTRPIRQALPIFHTALRVPRQSLLSLCLISHTLPHSLRLPVSTFPHQFPNRVSQALQFVSPSFSARFLSCGDVPVLLSALSSPALWRRLRKEPLFLPERRHRQQEHRCGSALLFLQIVIVISDIVDECLSRQLQNPGCSLIDKVTVVGNVQYRSSVILQRVFQNLL